VPITIQATEGVLTAEGKRRVVAGVSNAQLEAENQLDNPMTRRHLIATAVEVPADSTFADSQPTPFVLVSMRKPVGSIETLAQREQFVKKAAAVILKAAEGRIEHDRVYINLFYGNGLWGIGTTAYSNETLDEVTKAAVTSEI
jgi:hypothetical protein